VYSKDELASRNVTVPAVKNMSVTDAKTTLEGSGFSVRVIGGGSTVTDQVPSANVSVISGTEVIIYAGEAKPEAQVSVPSLYGKTYSQAKNALEAAGLYCRTTGVAPSASSSTIVVSAQSLASGTQVAYGTVIEVTLVESDTSIMETRG
jgi:beta-lactam-binding protein with PASTA domain